MKKRPWHKAAVNTEPVGGADETTPESKNDAGFCETIKKNDKKRKACGAKTRKGSPCKNTRLYPNGRCKNHGGLSTGPKTEAGKARAKQNLVSWKGND